LIIVFNFLLFYLFAAIPGKASIAKLPM